MNLSLKQRLLFSTAFLFTATSPAVHAQSAGIVNDQDSRLRIDVGAGETVCGDSSGVVARNGPVDLTNAGTICGNGSDASNEQPDGGVVLQAGSSHIVNSGTIEGTTFGIATNVYYNAATDSFESNAAATLVENSGEITGNQNDGIRLFGGGSVVNSGVIQGLSGSLTDGVSMLASALTPGEAIRLDNGAEGTISGARFGAILTGPSTIVNAGEIRGDSAAIAVQSDPTLGGGAIVTNSGMLLGGHGITFSGLLELPSLDNSGTITGSSGYGVHNRQSGVLEIENRAGGDITGGMTGVFAELGPVNVNNAGTIRGNGTNASNAAPDGGIILGGGPSTINNSGTVSGATFGIATDVYYNAATDSFESNASRTAIENSGVIIGETNDAIRLFGGGSVVNSGRIEGVAGSLTDGVSMLASALTPGEAIRLDNGAEGVISGARFGAILSGPSVIGNAGEIRGGVAAVAVQSDPILGGGTRLTNSGTMAGASGVQFGGILEQAELVNGGSITGDTLYGVVNEQTGTLSIDNRAGATIRGARTGVFAQFGPVEIDNAGTIRGDGGNASNASPDGGVILTSAGSRIDNSGTISGATFGIATDSYYDAATDSFEANGFGTTIVNSGTITGENNDAIRLVGGGSVANSGTIQGLAGALTDGISLLASAVTRGESVSVTNASSGTISGARFGIILSGPSTIDNAGEVTGAVAAVTIQSDPVLGGNQSVMNSGSMRGANGLQIGGLVQRAEVVNSGAIIGTTGFGIVLDGVGPVSLDNAGTITGSNGTAVRLGASDDEVTLRTGSVINGTIDAGGGIDRLNLEGDILELTVAQQLTAVSGFEALHVGSGYWSTSGAVGAFDGIAIDQDATLQINGVATGIGGETSSIQTPAVTTNGLLVLNFGDSEAVSSLENLTLSGNGGLHLIGEAVFTVDGVNLAHTGGTTISNGGLVLTGLLQGDVVTAGDGYFELGAGGTEGSFAGDIVNNGRFVFNRSDNYDFLGAFSGNGKLDKRGEGVLTFLGDYGFQGVTNIFGGAVRIGGMIDPETAFDLGNGGTLDVTGNDQTIGGLSGAGGTNVVVGGNQLTIDQAGNTSFGGTISGDGSLVKTGNGTLNLTGGNSYTGPTTVNGGTLAVNGSIVSPVIVNDGGTLGGNGRVGSTTIHDGGTIAPGNSIGRLAVAGDLAFLAGSAYEVEVNAAGDADRIDATGAITIASTAAIAVLAEAGDYDLRTDYIILTGANGITGRFGTVTTDLAFLDPVLRYDPGAVRLSLYRNDIDFADTALGSNQAGVAAAIQSLGFDNPVYEAVVQQNAVGSREAFAYLSGELLASTISGLTDDSRHLRGALSSMTAPESTGPFVWGSAFGGWSDFDARTDSMAIDSDHKGFATGIGYGGNGFGAALSAGIGSSDIGLAGRGDRARADSKYLAAHLTYGGPEGIRGAAGVSHAWHDVDSSRAVSLTPIAQTLTSSRDANSLQFFGELGYGVTMGRASAAPFFRIAHVQTKSDAFVEAGGNAALAVAKAKQNITFLSLGAALRFNAEQPGFQPHASLAWSHASGDRAAPLTAAFASGGARFALVGALIPEHAVDVEAGLDYSSGTVRIGAAYSGTLASGRSNHGARVSAVFAF